MSYCRDEDTQALAHFGAGFQGRFLDLGANNGMNGSTTLLLAEHGWSGVWVEPNWSVMGELIARACAFSGRVQIVQGAVGLRHGLVPYWDASCLGEHSSEWSTCSQDIQTRSEPRARALKLHVPVFTPADLVDAFPGEFHVVSIDLEGWSLDIMRAFPWDLVGCRFAVIEAFRPYHFGGDERPMVREFMESKGFRHFGNSEENVVMVR